MIWAIRCHLWKKKKNSSCRILYICMYPSLHQPLEKDLERYTQALKCWREETGFGGDKGTGNLLCNCWGIFTFITLLQRVQMNSQTRRHTERGPSALSVEFLSLRSWGAIPLRHVAAFTKQEAPDLSLFILKLLQGE